MLNDNPNLEQLINYYQELIVVNTKFNDIHELTGQNDNYEELVKQLKSIRDLLIKRDLSNINMFYRPLERLFNNKGHYRILETIILQFRQNSSLEYLVQEENTGNVESNDLSNVVSDTAIVTSNNGDFMVKLDNRINKIEDDVLDRLNSLQDYQNGNTNFEQNAEIVEILNEVQKSIKLLTSNEFYSTVAKSSNDIMANLTTNYELMKADINRYDAMLTDHINKSGIDIAETIEKEHVRFRQKISSDSNAIIAGIADAIVDELSKQTDLVKASVKEIENKLFKYISIIFVISIGFMFTCSILTSSWTANKVVAHIKAIKITAMSNSNKNLGMKK